MLGGSIHGALVSTLVARAESTAVATSLDLALGMGLGAGIGVGIGLWLARRGQRARDRERGGYLDRASELVTVAAHDLRNPLHALGAHLSLVERRLSAGERDEVGPQVAQLRRGLAAMNELCERFLDLSLLEETGLPLALGEVDLAELASERVGLFAPAARQKELDLELSGASQVPGFCGDRLRLGAVLDNLLSNAIKFSEPGGRVRLELSSDSAELRTEVTDCGPGLAEAELSRLFDGGGALSAGPTGGEASRGVGLRIVRETIEALGGRVFARRSEAHGLTVGFALPLASPPGREASFREPPRRGTNEERQSA